MSNQVDKFFASKLSEHSIEPDTNAWSRIAANLPKKNNAIIWFRAAAGIAIAGLSLMLWFYSAADETIDNRVAQESDGIEAKDEVVTNQEEAAITKEKQPISNDQRQETMLAAQEDQNLKKKVKNKVTNTVKKSIIVEPAKEVAQLDVVETLAEQIETIDLTSSQATKVSASKPIVIVFELKPIKKIEDPFDLDLFPQKKSGIKKVLEIANDVRTGESPIGGLRQAKEEIFAFNFKKEDKNNNK